MRPIAAMPSKGYNGTTAVEQPKHVVFGNTAKILFEEVRLNG
jgi:hypothetical protein